MALLNVPTYAIPYIMSVKHKYWIFSDFLSKFFPGKSLISYFYELCMKAVLAISISGNEEFHTFVKTIYEDNSNFQNENFCSSN